MSRRALLPASVLAVAACLLAPSARAQEEAPFSQRGHTVIVLDNLGGFVHSEASNPNVANSGRGTNVWGIFPFSPVARFGVHEFIGDTGLSLGGAIIYSDSNTSVQQQAGTTFGIAPRIGYAIPFNASLALWLRAGITYITEGFSNPPGGNQWQFSPGGEAYLVITPVSHFGITLGPWIEWGVAGKECTGNNCQGADFRQDFYGGTFGILADF
jgi:hypothetical protein